MHFIKTLFLLLLNLTLCSLSQAAELTLTKTNFSQLPGWQQDNPLLALKAFQLSCIKILKQEPNTAFHKRLKSGTFKDWQQACTSANTIQQATPTKARTFFEKTFQPYQLSDTDHSAGLFTGYYLPLLHGSLTYSSRYHVPVYALPHDLIKTSSGIYQRDPITKQLRTYPDRAAINAGRIHKQAQVLLWTDSLLDLFFAQVQGSALVQLTNGQRIAIGYAGGNGHPYTSIGKVLVAKKAIEQQNVSMQSIRRWLTEHPHEALNLLNQNASFVFFKILPDHNPLGTQRVPLTPGRSLAVDTRYLPLGTPVWLSSSIPLSANKTVALQRLLIAQDTGGAIQGIVRGDVYWGAGIKAEFIAGHMQQTGQYWVLLPIPSKNH